jgi:hypothetical protein
MADVNRRRMDLPLEQPACCKLIDGNKVSNGRVFRRSGMSEPSSETICNGPRPLSSGYAGYNWAFEDGRKG